MKNNYFLALVGLLSSTAAISQEMQPQLTFQNELIETTKKHSSTNRAKSAGDTLFYEDFSGGFATNGWSTVDSSQNGHNWIYTTINPQGQYGTAPGIPNSTASNGFVALPSDDYNTPTPTGGIINMDSYLSSGPITITPVNNVVLRWKQNLRFASATQQINEQLELQVSIDGINYTSYDITNGLFRNFVYSGEYEVNITPIAANEDTLYLRFYQSFPEYYWLIDDITILEGVANQATIEETQTTFGTIPYNGFYTIIPKTFAQPIKFEPVVKNEGGFNLSNTKAKIEITHSRQGVVYRDSSSSTSTASPQDKDTLTIPTAYANNNGVGNYTAYLSVESDSADADINKTKDTIAWTISDTVFAKDYGVPFQSSWLTMASGLGLRFIINSPRTVTSASYYIKDVRGGSINPEIWGYDPSQPDVNSSINAIGLIATNQNPDTINNTGWVTVAFTPPVTLPPGEYILSADNSNGSSSLPTIRYDQTAEELQQFDRNVSTVFRNNGTWVKSNKVPMIRMNFGLLPITVPYYLISEIHQENATGVADSIGTYCFLAGTVAGIDFDTTAGLSFTIINNEDSIPFGIKVIDSTNANNYVVNEGDSLLVRGMIEQFNGLTQIRVDSVSLIATNTYLPSHKNVPRLNESTESELIEINDLTVSSISGGLIKTVSLTNGTNFYTAKILPATNILDSLSLNVGDRICAIKGIGGQNDNSFPYNLGYEITPSSFMDIIVNRKTIDTVLTCTPYTWQQNNNTYSASGSYFDTIPVSTNCDSIIELQLNIDTLDISVSIANDSLISNDSDAISYQWISCDSNNAVIPGATGISFKPTMSGNYAVIVSNGACSDTSSCTNIVITSLKSTSITNSFSLYPNPTKDFISIEISGNLEINEIKVYSISGRILKTLPITQYKFEVDLSDLADGIYFVKLGNSMKKMVLNK